MLRCGSSSLQSMNQMTVAPSSLPTKSLLCNLTILDSKELIVNQATGEFILRELELKTTLVHVCDRL